MKYPSGTPYLLSLGLTKSAVAMVFLAGPISGLVVQPLIGTLPSLLKGSRLCDASQVYSRTTQDPALVDGDLTCLLVPSSA